jgi:hypothetical protein
MEPSFCLYKAQHESGLGTLELRIDSTGELLGTESQRQATSIFQLGIRLLSSEWQHRLLGYQVV